MNRKSIVLLSSIILLVAILFTGCNFSFELPGEPEDISQVNISNNVTRVVEVTDKDGKRAWSNIIRVRSVE